MTNLESLFSATKADRDEKRQSKEESVQERGRTLSRNIDFVLNKLSFVTKHGGKFLRFNTGFQHCWINVMSPRFGNIGGISVSGTEEIDDHFIMRQTFDGDRGMTWDEIAVAIGNKF